MSAKKPKAPLDVRVEKHEDHGKGFPIDVKRFNVPATIHWTCPSCGNKRADNLDDRHLGYPIAMKPFDYSVSCGVDLPDDKWCEYEGDVKIFLELSLRLA